MIINLMRYACVNLCSGCTGELVVEPCFEKISWRKCTTMARLGDAATTQTTDDSAFVRVCKVFVLKKSFPQPVQRRVGQ